MLFEPVKNYSILFSITDATYYDFDKSIQYGNIEGQAFYSNFKGILVSCSVVMIKQEKKKTGKNPNSFEPLWHSSETSPPRKIEVVMEFFFNQ